MIHGNYSRTMPAIFITARFRSGSTMLWNIFRQIPEVVAYYEPLHEKLPHWITSGILPHFSHYNVDGYFKEYQQAHDLEQYHQIAFGVCRLYMEAAEQDPQLKTYLDYILHLANEEKIAVLKFHRIDFRLPWIKAAFPDIPLIHLYRSPREQWMASIADYTGDIDHQLDADPYLITTWSRDLCQQFPFLASPYIRHAYQRHYYLWKLSYLAGARLADISVAYEDILASPREAIAPLFQLAGLETATNLDRGIAVIKQTPLDTWKHYRNEAWFATLEQECDDRLHDLGLHEHFGMRPLADIIQENARYQRLIQDPCARDWGIRCGQLACVQQEILANEVYQTAINAMNDFHAHPLRPCLKRYLPRGIQQGIRIIRQRYQPRLGQLTQYPPIPLHLSHQPSFPSVLPGAALPAASIVTPSFNQQRFVERTIRSILTQAYPALEYILQDGNSIDGTQDILERYRGKFTHLESCQDGGQANAINRGFRHATGEIMAWLNADDVLLPGALAYVANFFGTHPDVDVVYSHRIIIDEHDQEIGRWILPPHDNNMLLWSDYIPQETLFWRRRIWERAGGYVNESYQFTLDWELLLRFREAGAIFVRLPCFLAAFRVHPQQKTSKLLESIGKQEMRRLRYHCHGREVSNHEALRQIRWYLRRHLGYHALYRAGLLRY